MTGRGLSELKVGGLTLRGVAKGGVVTSLMVPELKLLFDLGQVLPGAQAFDQVLVSHGHADHLGGLHYFISQRHLHDRRPPVVYVPAEIEDPLRRIFNAWREIEGFDLTVDLRPVHPGDELEVGKDLRATALRTTHRVPSLAYRIDRITHKLKPALQGRPREEILAAKNAGEEITAPLRTPQLCVTGDTQIEFLLENPEALSVRVLVHEVTSWDARRDVKATREWGHTHVDEIIPVSEGFTGEALVLVHRSMRHSLEEAQAVVAARFPSAVKDRVHVFA
ncbi:MAG: MBL fold metallo-hydrolase [Nannocystaceae bacterium]